VLDAQHFGVPQRRRRVFFVGHLGAPWSAPAEVLFELEGGAGDSAPSGETRSGVTAGSARGTGVLSRTGGGASSGAGSSVRQGHRFGCD
jgi:DNA (cytosine-5)-methyltransferase 1